MNFHPQVSRRRAEDHYSVNSQRSGTVAANPEALEQHRKCISDHCRDLQVTAMNSLFHHPLLLTVGVAWVIQLGQFACVVIQWRSNRAKQSD